MAEATPHELLVDVSDILQNISESVAYEGHINLEPIEMGAERFVPLSPAHVDALLTFAGSGVVVSGAVSVDMQANCSRCLCEFTLPVRAPLEGFYVEPGGDHDFPEDQEVELITDRSVDVYPAVRASVVLELPLAPLHDPECAGICPVCGVDLDEVTCSCERDVADSPFSALRALLDDKQGPA